MKQFYISIFSLLFTSILFSQSYQYTVQSIPYQEFQEQNLISFNGDDVYSPIINLPFEFDFYNLLDQSQIVVGSNADIVFDTSLAYGPDFWTIGESNVIPTTAYERKATIFAAFHDIINSTNPPGGAVFYGVSGESPTRRFYIFFENIPQYACNSLISTFQLVMHETTNIIDVYIKDKPVCEIWNSGRAIVGLQDNLGTQGIAAPGRNNTAWEAHHEGWRFIPSTNFNVVVCDVNNDQTELFNVDDYKNDILSLFNLDPLTNTINILDATNTPVSGDLAISSGSNPFTIVMNPETNNESFNLTISFVNCNNDEENDGIPNDLEDVNGNGNLADDDTDGDGIPNYLDDDDDGDTVISEYEIVFGGRNGNMTNPPTFLDTDNDGIPNHLDMDDDGDGVITLDEDYNGNGDPTDDDLNGNNIPDYLDVNVLNVEAISLNTTLFSVYPNPTTDKLFVQFPSEVHFSDASMELKVYNLQGKQVLQFQQELTDNKTQVDVSELSSGQYILVIKKDGLMKAKKFIKD